MAISFSESMMDELISCADDANVDGCITPEECMNFLYTDQRIKYFFEISLKSAQKRGDILGHTLFVCPDIHARKCFLKLLQNNYKANYRTVCSTALEKPGDLVALLTNLNAGDVLICKDPLPKFKDDFLEIISSAISSFGLSVTLGKGASANSFRLDLPEFTFVACTANANSTIRNLFPLFEYVIIVDNSSLPRLCAAQLNATASTSSIAIDEAACELIISKAQYDVTQSERYLKRIIEFISESELKVSRITSELAAHVFDLSGMADKFEVLSDEDEMFSIFRDIQETLHVIHSEMHEACDDINSRLTYVVDAIAQIAGDV